MRTHKISVRTLACFATAVLELILLPPLRSFGAETPRPRKSLTTSHQIRSNAALGGPANGGTGGAALGGGLQNNPGPGYTNAGPSRAIQPNATPSAVSKNSATLAGQQQNGGALGGGIQPNQVQPNSPLGPNGGTGGAASGGGLYNNPGPSASNATSKNSATLAGTQQGVKAPGIPPVVVAFADGAPDKPMIVNSTAKASALPAPKPTRNLKGNEPKKK